jgi:hypothetical protein
MSFLEQKRVLQLNGSWKRLRAVTPHIAFIRMSTQKKRPYNALHIEYPVLSDGSPDYANPCSIIPVAWADWIQLPVRPQDAFISTSNRKIRIPTVIIANNYREIPQVFQKYSKNATWERDNYTCQLTGERVTKKTGNIDHVIPRSKNGISSFGNCYVVKKELNSKRGNMPLAEFCKLHGYPMPKLEAPKGRPIVNTFNITDWELFPH